MGGLNSVGELPSSLLPFCLGLDGRSGTSRSWHKEHPEIIQVETYKLGRTKLKDGSSMGKKQPV